MAGGVKSEKKTNYLERVKKLLDEYNQMFFVECDNVGYSASHCFIFTAFVSILTQPCFDVT
jgi:hypothetical protein